MIKRELFGRILPYLEEREILLITGPRQAGKTTLLMMLKDYLEKKGKKTVFFNLDIERDRQFFVSQEALVTQIKLIFGNNRGYVFIDEIQRKNDAGLFLKGIYDMNLPYKFIVSGSGSLELKEKIHESLMGRKILFNLSTLSFKEFVNYKTDYRYENDLSYFFEVDEIKSEKLLAEYLNFGGYPRIVIEESLEKKLIIINEIFQSYLEKDISYLLGIKKTAEFINLVRLISAQIGQLVNVAQLSSMLGVSAKTVKIYLWYLEKTFILKKITPFYSNLRKEIIKMPVYYFNDLGMRNFAINQFDNRHLLLHSGFLFQNFIANLINDQLKFASTSLHFWRTQDKTEVDFIINTGKEIIPLEVKFKKLKKPEIPRSLKNFIKKYNPKRAYVVNMSLEETVVVEKTRLFFLPYWKMITKNFVYYDPGS